jgi:stage V sporulation protein AD
MSKRTGTRTFELSGVYAVSGGTIVGEMEGNGPLGKHFDKMLKDDLFGEETWEKAECRMFGYAVDTAVQKSGLKTEDVDCLIGGDLLDQLISASFAARSLRIPYLGVYGACSTFSEALLIGGLLIDSRSLSSAVCAASTHFATAERQYRMPLELGTGRPPTAQHTTTAAGACVLTNESAVGARMTFCTLGKVVDWGIKDANNMGAAMAPAAADTIATHLLESERAPESYDVILTGDLGHHGSELLIKLLKQRGFDISKNHADCGIEIYGGNKEVWSGGSGCGCSASVFSAYYLKLLSDASVRNLLLVSTGALLSPTSTLQGESVPGIAHAVAFEAIQGGG